jgi:LacI family transcriptional regulator
MKKETLSSIAQRTHCSVTTVSRVLNGMAQKYRISQTTADHILSEAQNCRYVPSMLAKGLRTNKTETIGLLVPSIENTFFAHIASVIIREAKAFDYKIVVADTEENESDERRDILGLLAHNVDGILSIPCANSPETFLKINSNGTPVVLVDRYFSDNKDLSYVTTDNYKGATMATEYLIQNGHRRILCIQGPPKSTIVEARVNGYIDTLKKYSLADNMMVSGDNFSIQNGYIETKLALNAHPQPTAIFALSNTILLGAIKAIKESNMHIPDDISLISFDDSILFNYLNPAITCINQPSQEIGSLAVKILMKIIKDEQSEPTHLLLPPSLIERHSVKNILNNQVEPHQ